MKKVLTLLLSILLLTACSTSGSNFVVEKEYVKPLTSSNLSDRLSDELSKVFKTKNKQDYILKDIGIDSPSLVLNDYYGQVVDFNKYKQGNLIIEVSAYWCTHCAQQTANNTKIIENSDVEIIQFFIDGDNDLIKEFYAKEEVEIPSDITVIAENAELQSYFVSTNIQMVPSFYFFKDGKLTYINVGLLTYEEYEAIKEYLFGDKALTRDSLVDNMGKSIFENYMDYNDVLNELSSDSKDKLALIDNCEELTVSIIGKDVNFNKLYDEEDGAIYKIDNFGKYLNDELVVFYLGNIHNNLESEIELINNFKAEHKDLNMLAILVDSKDISTSDAYKELDKKLNIDVISSNAEIPQVFVDTLINEYPACVFIQDNKLTGGFYNLESLEKMNRALETFVGENSIALV